ncbi:MAG: isoleucine--tRNA ligase, partial [Clostridia bacterium]|nr:isoleucine--tRNA ligase [Clostridia bacterium]
VKNGGTFEIADLEVSLLEEDLQILTESAKGYVAAADKGITVALDTALTEELIDEGVERELISKIQNMRKEAGFEVTDRIEIYFTAQGRVLNILRGGSFASAVLAEKVEEGTHDGFTKELSVNGEKATLTLVR